MQLKTTRHRYTSVLIPLVLGVLVACKGPAVAPQPAEEGTIRLTDRRASLTLGGKSFVIARKDGNPLGDMALAIDGTVYPLQGGSFKVPRAALDEAMASGKRIALIGRGFLPRLIEPGLAGGELSLVPVDPLGGHPGPAGSTALALYLPETAGDADLARRERAATIARVPGADPGACDAPLPCPPATHRVGIEIVSDGPFLAGANGTWPVALSLAELLGGWSGVGPLPPASSAWSEARREAARAAADIRTTFARIDATGNPAWRAALAAQGITLVGDTLTVSLPLPAPDPLAAGVVVARASTSLGVYFELTFVSTPQGGLPAVLGPAKPPVVGPGLAGGTGLPASPGGLAGGPGGLGTIPGVVGNNGGGVVGNNGASLTGTVRIPIISDAGGGIVSPGGPGAKFRLLTYTDYPRPNGVGVRLVDQAGAALTAAVTVDATSTYLLAGLPGVLTPVVFVQGQTPGAPSYTTYALVAAPQAAATRADHDAATTGVTCMVLDELRSGRQPASAINLAGYGPDTAFARAALSQAQAQFAVSQPVPQVAAMMRALFGATATSPLTIPIVTPPASGTLLASYPTGTLPFDVAVDPAGNIWVVNATSNDVTKLSPAGVVLGTFPVGVSPTNIAFSPTGEAWISNTADGSVSVLSPTGSLIGRYTTAASNPEGIGVDASGNAWVVNTATNSVQKFSPTGTVLATVAVGAGPEGLAVDSGGNAWVSLDGANAVVKISPAGVVLGSFPVGLRPSNLAIDAQDQVWVVNKDSATVSKLAPTGVVLGQFPVGALPLGVAIDGAGNAWVTNSSGNSLTKLSPTGAVLGTFTGITAPVGVTVDAAGFIWVADGTNQVHKFAP
ncbi:MAG: repeat containing protein [Cyanobacteria bacterium RYN_339]|nr:repeat containing protein [Cyanobacteria bacterium RYN_339]